MPDLVTSKQARICSECYCCPNISGASLTPFLLKMCKTKNIPVPNTFMCAKVDVIQKLVAALQITNLAVQQ